MANFIPDEFIQKVLDETDIVSLIDSVTPLKKKGKDHWALCPFCDDGKNPAFSVSDQKQFYYCFKCRASGNAIGFLMNYHSKDFLESVEMLAKNLGLEIPITSSSKDMERYSFLYGLNDLAKDFYLKNITSDPGAKKVRKYLNERGIKDEILRDFEVGYAPEGWDNLIKHFNNLKQEIKMDTGLFKEGKKDRLYDVFRNRIIFPIFTKKQKVAGFGGRVIDVNDNPKYLNSPESEVFKKSRELYGLPNVLKINSKPDQIIVVEGYMDVLACFSFNLPFAVATLGIATNKFHIETLFSKTDEIIFCFDGDEAGKNASKLALEIAIGVMKDGKKIKFLFLPDNHDPASLLLEEGSKKFKELIKSATNLSAFLLDTILEKYDETIESKAAASKEFLSSIRRMPDSNFKAILKKEFSKKLGIELEDNKKIDSVSKKHSFEKEENMALGKVTKSILKCIIHNPDLAKSEYLDFFDRDNSFVGELIAFLRTKSEVSFPVIIQQFPSQKNFLIDLSNDPNLISADQGLDFIRQAIDYLKKSDKSSRKDFLKSKFQDSGLEEKEKLELKKLLTLAFESLDEKELSLLKEL